MRFIKMSLIIIKMKIRILIVFHLAETEETQERKNFSNAVPMNHVCYSLGMFIVPWWHGNSHLFTSFCSNAKEIVQRGVYVTRLRICITVV